MFFDKNQFIKYQVYRVDIIIANGATVWIKGRKTIVIKWLLSNKVSNTIDVKNILHVPNLVYKLFSISQAIRKEFEIIFIDDNCYLRKNGNLLRSASKVNNTYILSVLKPIARVAVIIQRNIKALAITHSVLNKKTVEL